MSVSYHESQVTFFKVPSPKEAEEKLLMCKGLIGGHTYSLITGKSGKMSSARMNGNNVFLRVEVED